MKKLVCKMLCVILFLSFMFQIKVNAAIDDSPYRKAKFVGEIVANREFYKGELLSSNDFTINGRFLDSETMKIIPTKKWKMLIADSADGKSVIIRFLYVAPYDRIVYRDVTYTVPIKIRGFSKHLTPNIDLNNPVNLDSNNVESLNLEFYNSLNQLVPGDVYYSQFDKNKVNYVFIPKETEISKKYGNYSYKNEYVGTFDTTYTNLTVFKDYGVNLNAGEFYINKIVNDVSKSKIWYTDNERIIKVNSSTGRIKALNSGKANLYCELKMTDGESITLKCYVVVK